MNSLCDRRPLCYPSTSETTGEALEVIAVIVGKGLEGFVVQVAYEGEAREVDVWCGTWP